MKLLLVALGIVVASQSSFAVNAVRVMDGRSVVCTDEADVGIDGIRVGEYSYSQTSHLVNLKATVSFFVCARSAQGEISWQPRSLFAAIKQAHPDDRTQELSIQIQEYVVQLLGYSQKVGLIELYKKSITENAASIALDMTIPLEALLSADQAAQLEQNGTVTVYADLASYSVYETFLNRVSKGAGYGTSGMFRFPMVLKKP